MHFNPLGILKLFLCLCMFQQVKAQTEDFLPGEIRDWIEQLSEQKDREYDFRSLTEDLRYYLEEPLNINQADAEDLGRLHLLTPYQIHSLLSYRKQYGEFLSLYELPLVYGFSKELVRKLEPFLIAGEPERKGLSQLPPVAGMLQQGRHQVILRGGRILERQEGFMELPDSIASRDPNALYKGSPLQMYSQWSFRYRNLLRMGLTADKDPGETFLRADNPYGFDFTSFHLYLQDTRWVDKLALGDFDIRYGQGLVVWSGFSLSKSTMVFGPIRHQTSMDPYTSSNENNFFRGVAAERSLDPFKISLFYSRKRIDANITDTLADGVKVFSSFQQTGYHRIPREIYDERSICEQVAGGSLSLNLPHVRLGLNAMGYSYGGRLERPARPENAFRFCGQSNSNWSLDYQATWSLFHFFGEEAITPGAGFALLNGLSARLTERVAMMVLHRHYEKDYQALYSAAFSEGARAQNEQGLYWGFQLDLMPDLLMKGYLDTWRFPWLSYFSDAPVSGWDGLLELKYTPARKLEMHLRYQQESRNGGFGHKPTDVASLEEHGKYRIRYHLRYQLTSSITSDNRIEWASVHTPAASRGLMIYQDIGYQSPRWPLRFDIRYAVFDTDDYSSRIYAYEDDLLYRFSVPSYYSRGYRAYLNVKYSWRNMDFWMKLARTAYVDKQEIGSGLQQIEGNHKSSLYFQMRMRF